MSRRGGDVPRLPLVGGPSRWLRGVCRGERVGVNMGAPVWNESWLGVKTEMIRALETCGMLSLVQQHWEESKAKSCMGGLGFLRRVLLNQLLWTAGSDGSCRREQGSIFSPNKTNPKSASRRAMLNPCDRQGLQSRNNCIPCSGGCDCTRPGSTLFQRD